MASIYDPLADFLSKHPAREASITLSFSQVEVIVHHKLPRSAHTYREWWANDTVGHVQSRVWLNAGWKVDTVDFTRKSVTFTRKTS